MSSLDTQTRQGQAENVQPGTQQAQAPLQPGQSPSTGTTPALPPTALSMQLTSLNNQYQQQQQQALPYSIRTGVQQPVRPETGSGAPGDGQYARLSLSDMADRLARSYGLDVSRGSLVDAEGNFMMTPDQLAMQSNQDMGMVAADMNRIAQAINDRQVEQQQAKATAALQAGMGQVQQRGRGSLAAMQSNFYQQMAANYTDPNLLPEQADFSFWIQKAGFDEAANTRMKEEQETATKPTGTSDRPMVTTPTATDPRRSTDTGPQGKGDVVTTGPNAGKRPVYTYDPIAKTTTVSWESA